MSQNEFSLIETILFEPKKGFYLLDLHLKRLQTAICDFKKLFPESFPKKLSNTEIASTLNEQLKKACDYYRVRLLVDTRSEISIECAILDKSTIMYDSLNDATMSDPLCLVVLDKQAINTDTRDPFLSHKTTNRSVYDIARERTQCTWDLKAVGKPFDVILWNKNNHITETSIANIAVRSKDGQGNMVWKTPKLSCGLLPGVFRTSLLLSQREPLIEDIITVNELINVHKV
ncbi:aminotransferase [Mycotypha africana]|uniref:aminotransferase n=1 Tax=Mycotypha africana TaxID=64632 RepID=UPI0023006394|nr:aminotransferase [Mycotypha africana]KAI8977271.1 aminotransferase [Mycotypha africana]